MKENQTLLILFVGMLLFISADIFFPSKHSKKSITNFPYENYALTAQYKHEGEGLEEYKKAVFKELKKMKLYRNVGTTWDIEGPHNTGGRINTIALHPTNSNTIFVGCADGGIFKTADGGTTWAPVFDNAYALSVSEITIDKNNPQIMYVGTGDHVLGGYSHMGNGIYKSTNGGSSWVQSGLTQVGTIGKIVIDPSNSNILYAATTGNPFISDNNRGLYKSTDAGVTWTQVLFLGQNAGVADLVIDPNTPTTLYCTGRYRKRSDSYSLLIGPEARIYKSTNGGSSWDTLSNGLPTGLQCRIGLAISNTNPNTIYANYVDTSYEFGGLYKTTDGGNNWTAVNTNTATVNMGGFGWYFGEVRLNPFNNSQIFIMGVDLGRSTNSGVSFSQAGYTHSDKHDMEFASATTLYLATDGGLYKSTNGGTSFTSLNNFPITQFYRVAYNLWMPDEYFGGAQDNGSNYGSSTSGLTNWMHYYGGDGFQPQFDPTDQDIFYAEWQNANIVATTDGGASWNDIFSSTNTIERNSWNTPYFISSFNNFELYTATYRVHKNQSGPVDAWSPISPDLTDGTNDAFHVVTALNQSTLNASLLYAGTSDARVWVTNDGGINWNLINTGLPTRNVSCVKSSPSNPNAVFVSMSGYRNNDSVPHIYYSTNKGNTWVSIAGNLPNFAINDIWIDPLYHDSALIIANDGGVYATQTQGQSWERVGTNMPIIPVYDIEYNPNNHKIFAGTFARSMQSMHKDSIIIPPHQGTGMNEVLSSGHILIYPNPSQHEFFIESTWNIEDLYVIDMFGRNVYHEKGRGKKMQVNITSLASGPYLLVTETEKGRRKEKFVKSE